MRQLIKQYNMSKNFLKKEPIELHSTGGSVTIMPKNGNYWTKKDVLTQLEAAGIKFPMYDREYYRKEGKGYTKLSQGEVSAIMLFDFWLRYVSPSEEFTVETLEIMANNGIVLHATYQLSRLLIEGSYADKVQFYADETDEVFTAGLTDEGSIIITNTEGNEVEVTFDDVLENVTYWGNNTFTDFNLVDEVDSEIEYQCQNGFPKKS